MRNFLFLLIAGIFLLPACEEGYSYAVREQVRGMKTAWNSGQPAKVAEFYLDSAFLIAGGDIIAEGRKAIDAYWRKAPGEPTQWRIESYLTTKELEAILQHPKWKALPKKPALWTEMNIELPEDVVYQFGRSKLGYTDAEGREQISEVTFLLVWVLTKEGHRILVDTYV